MLPTTDAPLAVRRAITANVTRLFVLAAFVAAVVVMQLCGFAVPRALAPLLGWMVVAGILGVLLPRVRKPDRADRLQTAAYCVDLIVTDACYALLGGGWWLGVGIHSLIVTFAFGSLPRRRARFVALFALLCFAALIAAEVYGAIDEAPLAGLPTLRSNQPLAVLVLLFGTVTLGASAAIQSGFVRIMRRAQERFRALVRSAPDMILTTDRAGRIASANPVTQLLTGLPADDLVGTHLTRLARPEDRPLIEAELILAAAGESRQFELECAAAEGSVRVLSCMLGPIRDEERLDGLLFLARDITERKRIEQDLLHQSQHDRLTGLSNRAHFLQQLARALSIVQRHPHSRIAVLYLDLDRFKGVNDSLGHSMGDDLLVAVARRLRSSLRPADTVARLGGDEFAILTEDISAISDAARIAMRVQQSLSAAIDLGEYQVFSSASIGIAVTSDHPPDRAEDLLRNADIAMYRAKGQGRGRYALYDDEMHAAAIARLQLETDLRWALTRGEFALHYQPIVSLDTLRLHSVEALLRWQHPTRGLLGPAEFIAVAEEMGLIVAIGTWALEQACTHLSQWHARFPRPDSLAVSVNVSVKQFTHSDFVEQVTAIIERTGVPPSSVKLEVTEGVVFDDVDGAIHVLSQFKRLGVQVYLDDFGQGYSSLSYLNRLPLDAIKIDRAFVQGMFSDDTSVQVIRTIFGLARALGLRTVAEGVETQAQLAAVRAQGCDFAQGYLFSPPVSSRKLELLLALESNGATEAAVAS